MQTSLCDLRLLSQNFTPEMLLNHFNTCEKLLELLVYAGDSRYTHWAKLLEKEFGQGVTFEPLSRSDR